MKRMKLIVAGGFVLAIVGSALAFTPKSYSDFCLFQKNGSNVCAFVQLIKNVGSGGSSAINAYSKATDADCVTGGSVPLGNCATQVFYDPE